MCYACVCGHVHAIVHVWRSQDSLEVSAHPPSLRQSLTAMNKYLHSHMGHDAHALGFMWVLGGLKLGWFANKCL